MATSEKYNNVTLPKRKIFFNNFLGGIAWAFGTFIGFIVIFLLLGTILTRVNLVPIVGNFLSQVVNEAVKNSPHLIESPR